MDLQETTLDWPGCPSNLSGNSSELASWPDVSENFSNSSLFLACNCTAWKMDTKDAAYISIIRIVTSIFGIAGSASIILLVLLTGKLNTAEVHPLFILSVADFILAILWLIGGIVWLSPGENGWAKENSDSHTGMCYVLAVATTMGEIATFLLTAVYAQSAFLRIREYYLNKGKPLLAKDNKKRLRYIVTGISYILSWLLPLVVVLAVTEKEVGIEATHEGCWCIVDFFNLRPDNGLSNADSVFNHFAIVQASLVGPFFVLSTIFISLYYIATLWYTRKIYIMQTWHGNQHRQHRPGKFQQMIRTVIIRLSLFIFIFVVCGAPTLAGAIAVWSEHNRLHLYEPQDRTILFIHAILVPMQGFWNAIVYGWSRKEFRRAVKLQDRSRSGSKYESLNNSRLLPDNDLNNT